MTTDRKIVLEGFFEAFIAGGAWLVSLNKRDLEFAILNAAISKGMVNKVMSEDIPGHTSIMKWRITIEEI